MPVRPLELVGCSCGTIPRATLTSLGRSWTDRSCATTATSNATVLRQPSSRARGEPTAARCRQGRRRRRQRASHACSVHGKHHEGAARLEQVDPTSTSIEKPMQGGGARHRATADAAPGRPCRTWSTYSRLPTHLWGRMGATQGLVRGWPRA